MFQYAFGLALREHFGYEVKFNIDGFSNYSLHNGYELEKVFSLNETYENILLVKRPLFLFFWGKVLKKYRGVTGHIVHEMPENEFSFIDVDKESKKSLYFHGYWQSFRYFEKIEKPLREKFRFPELVDNKNLNLIEFINKNETTSVHIRRGDYTSSSLHEGVCDKGYYIEAVKKIRQIAPSSALIIFSDDIDWCKFNLDLDGSEVKFVDWNKASMSYVDMHLMSLCNHNIIANSTFSWWGAWLNDNPDKTVIAPRKWVNKEIDFSDILPEKWIKC
jgi:hypothetical protein